MSIPRTGRICRNRTSDDPVCPVPPHYSGVIMSAMASQITSLTFVYSTVYSGADQRKHQSSASLAFVRGIYRWPVNSPHKGPVTRKMFPFDDVIMVWVTCAYSTSHELCTRFMHCILLWFATGEFTHILQGYFANNARMIRLAQRQWKYPVEYK